MMPDVSILPTAKSARNARTPMKPMRASFGDRLDFVGCDKRSAVAPCLEKTGCDCASLVTPYGTISHLSEVSQHRQSHALALLGVKLRREYVLVPYGRCEGRRVVGLGCDQDRVLRHHVV